MNEMGNWKTKDDYDMEKSTENEQPIIPIVNPKVEKKKKTKRTSNVSSIQAPNAPTKEATEYLSKEMVRILQQDTIKDGYKIEPIEDNIFKWNVFLINFDNETQIAKDLNLYAQETGKNNVRLEVVFPFNFPFLPPFIRIVYPRFHQYTGHVTIGGSICIKDLTIAGWNSKNDLTSFFIMIRNLLLEGFALIDMDNLTEYTEVEAVEAFNRVAKAHGWQT
jgi:ubiquitin-conjugating enzyme E2 Q